MPVSRAEALSGGRQHYFTGKPCKHGHVEVRFVSSGECMECSRVRAQRWSTKNPDKIRTMRKASAARNADKVTERYNRWLAKNPEYHANYRQQNSDKRALYEAKRRSAKAAAMLGHLTEEQLEQIAAVYAEAKRLTEETGVLHHVDHIIPLQGRDVSGLHVPWNLQVITGSDNSRKGNRLPLDNQALDAVQARKDEMVAPPRKPVTNPYAA